MRVELVWGDFFAGFLGECAAEVERLHAGTMETSRKVAGEVIGYL